MASGGIGAGPCPRVERAIYAASARQAAEMGAS